MQHSYYGELRGDFKGSGWEFFKRGWWLWLHSAVAIVTFVATIVFFSVVSDVHILRPLVFSVVAIIVFPPAPFLYAEFKTRQWRWWLSGIRVGGMRLESTLPHRALYGVYWKVTGWLLLLFLVYAGCVFIGGMLIYALGGETAVDPRGRDSINGAGGDRLSCLGACVQHRDARLSAA